MKRVIIKLLTKLVGNPIRLVTIGEFQEKAILRKLAEIEGIKDWLEVQKQAGYALYARTDDRQYIGFSTFCQTLLKGIEQVTKQEPEEIRNDNGYESTV